MGFRVKSVYLWGLCSYVTYSEYPNHAKHYIKQRNHGYHLHKRVQSQGGKSLKPVSIWDYQMNLITVY